MGRATSHELWPKANARLGARPSMGRATPQWEVEDFLS